MTAATFPFAIRLIGFESDEAALLNSHFSAAEQAADGFTLQSLAVDSLQDPDFYLVNAEQAKALAVLADLHVGDARPVLLIGNSELALPYPAVARPLQRAALFAALKLLIARRADALARLAAHERVAVPERRRRERVDIDLSDPADYLQMRRAPARGGVLVVDRSSAFRDTLAQLLARQRIEVAWAGGADAAVNICNRSPVAVVLINTSVSGLDPYLLCTAIKNNNAATKTAVVFLNGPGFAHDSARARQAGYDGLLDKPLTAPQVLGALRKFMPIR
jgi:CheY-like chemotaxis protein